VDFGDAPVLPADAVASHRAIEETVAQVVAAGVLPVILGGDHSITEPDVRACAAAGPVGLVHFDTHTDTGTEVFGVELSHGTPMYKLVEEGSSTRGGTSRSACAATGPARRSSPGSASAGSGASSCTTSASAGSGRSSRTRSAGSGRARLPHRRHRRARPAFAPGPGRPSRRDDDAATPLGLPEIASRVELVGADVVEVIPTAVGSADITALAADRIVREILTGWRSREGR
jgi:agmatinase